MLKVKVYIVEDDFIHANRLSMYLDEMGYELVGTSDNSDEAVNAILSTKPDLVLMDIHIDGQRDGIEITEILNRKFRIPVIFITSFRDQETFDRAKLTNPYGYILKPYDKKSLQLAIELVIYKLGKENEGNLKLVSSNEPFNWKEDQLIAQQIFVKSEGRLIKIDLNDICSVEVKDKICIVSTPKQKIHVRITLSKLEDKLKNADLLRVHRSFMINVTKIDEVDLVKNEIFIQNNYIPIGRNFREQLILKLENS